MGYDVKKQEIYIFHDLLFFTRTGYLASLTDPVTIEKMAPIVCDRS